MGSFDFIYHGDLYGLDLWHKAWLYGNLVREHNLILQSRRTIHKVNCGNSSSFCSSLIYLHTCVCVFLYIVYPYMYHSVYIYIYIWSPHFSLLVCCSFRMFYYSCVHEAQSKSILKGYKETSQCLWLEFERDFSYNKREVSGSLNSVNIGLLSRAHQHTFQLISLLVFQVPMYTLAFCCLSVTHTLNASMAEIF